jgi:hypothetical protein
MKEPRRIDGPITQAADDLEALLWRLATTLNVAHTEAKLFFQRQLENYEILENRVRQIRELLPKKVSGDESLLGPSLKKDAKPAKRRPRGQKLLQNGERPDDAK